MDSHAVLCNAVIGFDAGSPLAQLALDTFVRDYTPYTPGAESLELASTNHTLAFCELFLYLRVPSEKPLIF